jgi:predicted Zn finger-like uncharacterized protein
MSIQAQCPCGKSYHVKDELAGRKVRCAKCGAVIAVPVPEPASDGEVDDQALQFLLTTDAPKPKPSRPAESEKAVQAEPPRPAPKPPPRSVAFEPAKPEPARPRPRKERPPREEESGRRRLVISPGIITGVLMMVGAVVWFVLGLLGNRFFIYPPIMFVLGLVAVIKGLLGHAED